MVVLVDIHDGSMTAGMSVLVIMAEMGTHDGSVDTVDWPLQLCMDLVDAAAAADNIFVGAALLLRIHFYLMLRMQSLLFGVMLPSDVSCQITRSYIGTVTKLAIIRPVFLILNHKPGF